MMRASPLDNPAMGRVFINYRRETDRDAAGRLRDKLEAKFSAEGIFIDVDNIQPGKNFVEEISASIDKCDIFLAVIGPGWTDVRDREGIRRLDNSKDWVRVELEAALKKGKVIIPVLVNAAEMPAAAALPDSLVSLAEIHAARLTHERYSVDVRGLIDVIEGVRTDRQAVPNVTGSRPQTPGKVSAREDPRRAVASVNERSFVAEFLAVPAPQKTGFFAAQQEPSGQFNQSDLVSPETPDWASDIGQDDYGRWAQISVGPALQRLRWLPPGQFYMGSPESEFGRDLREGPRHKVIIPDGLWLFDTACTQELWAAVMGGNPSRFKGAKRPVDSISWDDVQIFLQKINNMISGLEMTLPSETQWEYACRANTTTSFNFGSNISPEKVNYNGDQAAFGTAKNGLYRKETVVVGSLPPNDWGLFEMHGNVWEWCADTWHDNYEGTRADGSARTANGSPYRVMRGGSWNRSANHVRSASRGKDVRSLRHESFGCRGARLRP